MSAGKRSIGVIKQATAIHCFKSLGIHCSPPAVHPAWQSDAPHLLAAPAVSPPPCRGDASRFAASPSPFRTFGRKYPLAKIATFCIVSFFAFAKAVAQKAHQRGSARPYQQFQLNYGTPSCDAVPAGSRMRHKGIKMRAADMVRPAAAGPYKVGGAEAVNSPR